jgi:hypothetical protein
MHQFIQILIKFKRCSMSYRSLTRPQEVCKHYRAPGSDDRVRATSLSRNTHEKTSSTIASRKYLDMKYNHFCSNTLI